MGRKHIATVLVISLVYKQYQCSVYNLVKDWRWIDSETRSERPVPSIEINRSVNFARSGDISNIEWSWQENNGQELFRNSENRDVVFHKKKNLSKNSRLALASLQGNKNRKPYVPFNRYKLR